MATRIEQLALHKPSLLRYPDRRSVYWLDDLAPVRTSSTTFKLTARGSQLCRSKRLFSSLDQIRSPIWGVSEGALKACASKRVCALAQPRPPAVGWLPDRLKHTPHGSASRSMGATSRIIQLSQPRRRSGMEEGHRFKTPPVTCKTPTAMPRIELLATPKHEHSGYVGERLSSWPVPRTVRQAVPSKRVQELASPKQRQALFQGYDPYIVSASALLANPSPRLQEIALPLPRKCRST